MANPRIGGLPNTPAAAPAPSGTAHAAASQPTPPSTARPTGHATQGPLAALRRSNSMTGVHHPPRGISSAMRISVQVGAGTPQVHYTSAYVNYGAKKEGMLVHEDHDTAGDPSEGTLPATPPANDHLARRERSPDRNAQGRRERDTLMSINDAETHMLREGVSKAQDLIRAAGNKEMHVEIEYHGNYGPCGDREDLGCKGRLAKSSETLAAVFDGVANAGSTFKASSVYTTYDTATRGEQSTHYGYPNFAANMTYGDRDDKYEVKARTVLETRKPPAANAPTASNAPPAGAATQPTPAGNASQPTGNAPAGAAQAAATPPAPRTWANIASGRAAGNPTPNGN
jgi:hypothetical protein